MRRIYAKSWQWMKENEIKWKEKHPASSGNTFFLSFGSPDTAFLPSRKTF